MDNEELIKQAKRIADSAANCSDKYRIEGLVAQAREFLRIYAGNQSSFYLAAKNAEGVVLNAAKGRIASVLESFIEYVEQGLEHDISPERRAQLDVVSDFLDQANSLLESKGVHPAAPAVLIGATLEEFLRTWVESESISLGSRNPSLDSYAKALKENGLITKQDVKDITAWGGTRNHAAHGEWDEVSDKKRVQLMLEGVNLFMRKYGV